MQVLSVYDRVQFFGYRLLLLAAGGVLAWSTYVFAQPPGFGPGGPGGPGGPDAPDIELVDEFDANEDGYLNAEERKLARASLDDRGGRRRRGPGRGPRGRGPGGERPEGTQGPAVDVEDVRKYGEDENLYDIETLRTIFLDFENEDWEAELEVFKPTDVEIAATMTVDGKTYPNVGVSFRGASSFFTIPSGSKRSLNLSVDFLDKDQRLYGYKSLNLLNCNGDASMMSSYLYHDIASKKIATPKVNFVKVVINGRSWGVYANAQQFNKDFLQENYDSKKGDRWKVSGSPAGRGGLTYEGEDIDTYREHFEIKSKDKKDAWIALTKLCRVLKETPVDQLEAALAPMLDIDGVLWFLAVDVALVNSDGYWTRASDYNIYRDKEGVFHILPHDMNEAFHSARGGPGGGGRGGPPRERGPGGPPDFDRRGRPDGPGPEGPGERGQERRRRGFGGGFGGFPFPGRGPGGPGRGPGGGPGHGGVDLDPLVGIEDDHENRFPLRSKLLANENLRKRYLQYVHTIAKEYLSWEYLGSRVATAREIIVDEIRADTRKLMSTEDFLKAVDDQSGSLREFCDKRREYLLGLAAIKEVAVD